MRAVLVVCLILAACAKHPYKPLIRQGVGCAQMYWNGYPLSAARVKNVTLVNKPVECNEVAANGCWSPYESKVIVNVGLNSRGERRTHEQIVSTMAHEWSHVMWQRFSEDDPTEEVNWREACK